MEQQITIKGMRVSKGLKQSDVAKSLGLNRYTYMKYEKNPRQIKLGMFKRICEVLGCSINDIFIP